MLNSFFQVQASKLLKKICVETLKKLGRNHTVLEFNTWDGMTIRKKKKKAKKDKKKPKIAKVEE